ncbi:phosphopantetheine-binding protein [Geofilum rhodophaeum]|uniref:phosphopantetheine-binding protein n=1 Tax=Geofilum rhodophaeum TaxID=1965019 RepID=UPI000B522C04|nr:phosphopantetheine-binding protein [Geofilum rhodophaeum]
MNKEALKSELKVHLVKYLNILDYTPEDITDDMPLFGDGLALDSIDSLELIVMLEREYGIKITNPADGRKILSSIEAMATYIMEVKK